MSTPPRDEAAGSRPMAQASESGPPRWLDVTVLLCGSLVAACAAGLLAVTVIKLVSSTGTLSLNWVGGSSTAAAATRQTVAWEEELPVGVSDPLLVAVAAAVQQRSGQWDRPE